MPCGKHTPPIRILRPHVWLEKLWRSSENRSIHDGSQSVPNIQKQHWHCRHRKHLTDSSSHAHTSPKADSLDQRFPPHHQKQRSNPQFRCLTDSRSKETVPWKQQYQQAQPWETRPMASSTFTFQCPSCADMLKKDANALVRWEGYGNSKAHVSPSWAAAN